MKRIISALILSALLFALFACSDTANTSAKTVPDAVPSSDTSETENVEDTFPEDSGLTPSEKKTLVVYFSRTGEQYRVGVIDEGNTAVVAKIIAEKTGADLYEILPETDYYPYTYNELTDIAKQEQNENARPKIKDELPDISDYDIIFIGAPVWWGDWPMIMYTFFESVDFSGKKLVPFSTHEGSGLSGFDRKLASAAPGAQVLTGLAVRGSDCQDSKSDVKNTVEKWIDGLD